MLERLTDESQGPYIRTSQPHPQQGRGLPGIGDIYNPVYITKLIRVREARNGEQTEGTQCTENGVMPLGSLGCSVRTGKCSLRKPFVGLPQSNICLMFISGFIMGSTETSRETYLLTSQTASFRGDRHVAIEQLKLSFELNILIHSQSVSSSNLGLRYQSPKRMGLRSRKRIPQTAG